jgi:hypothetical protein
MQDFQKRGNLGVITLYFPTFWPKYPSKLNTDAQNLGSSNHTQPHLELPLKSNTYLLDSNILVSIFHPVLSCLD